MLNEETLSGILDIVKGILGVKAQNAEIMLTHDGKIIFRVDRSILYIVETDLFTIVQDAFIGFNAPISYLDPVQIQGLISAYNQCTNIGPLLIRCDNLQDNDKFLELTQLKSKDGMQYYNIYDNNHNTYRIPMYTGFVKFNKGDKADIEIYDMHPNPYLMNKFIVKKKKINYPIQVYFLTLKFN